MKNKIIEFCRQLKRDYQRVRRGLYGIAKTAYITNSARVSKDLVAGEYSYIGTGCKLYPKVKIGKFTMLANEVYILGADHFYTKSDLPIIFSGRQELKETIIGDDVWIGARSTILTGVKIGNGAIVAAGAVVTKDVEAYSIVAGIPAKKIKMRFNPDEIKLHEEILKLPIEYYKNNSHLLSSGKDR